MSDTATPIRLQISRGLQRPATRAKPRHAISRRVLSDGLLYFLAYFCLIRATGMWLGYPPTQDENALVDSGPQQLMLYSLIPFTLLYVWLNSKLVFGYIRRIPPTLAIFMGLVVISTLTSVSFVASLRGLTAVIVISLPILLFKNRFGSVKTIEMLRNFAVVAVFANLLYTAILPRYGVMGGSLAGSVRGLFLHKNFFGQFSAVAFLLLVPTLTQRPLFTYKNLRIAAACFLALVSVALSKSSTALVLSALGLASLGISWLIAQVPMKSLRIYVLLVSVTVLTGFVYFFGLAFAEDVASSFGKDITLSGRSELWDALLDALFERPWFGHGFAMFRQPDYIAMFTHQVAWGPRSTHNTYLELALNLGIPAIVMWVVFLLGRFVSKAVYVPATAVERMANSREVAVMLMVIVGSFTEAGMMLAPLATWPLLLAVLPETRKMAPPQQRTQFAGQRAHKTT
ncbi:MAG TPA: O-antigen ligase family protein [Arsenicitalea sp.]|jgi:O-antigen ligase|nr:O-antigen ligase family protein [Arsenicitalea sp.]